MALQAAAMMAFFVDQAQQAPVQIQCVQAVPEPTWKWIVQSVIPVAGGTLIAVWSFIQNRSSDLEQWVRDQKAEHEQWLRNQKRIEWRELLNGLNSVYFPMALAKQMRKPLPLEGSQKLLELSQCFQDRVFIHAAILTNFRERLETYAREYFGKSEDEPASDEAKSKVLDKLKQLTIDVREASKRDLEPRS